VNALILAGEDHDTDKLGTSVKALIDIHGKPMVKYIIDALKKSDIIDKIAMVGPHEKLYELFHEEVDYIVDGEHSIIDNVLEGMQYLGSEKEVIVSTSDIPMLTVECICDFIKQAQQSNADLCYPIVDKKVNELKFMGIERTYTVIKEGTFTGGNLFYINPLIVNKCCDKAKQLIDNRKNALKMAKILGWKTLLLLFTGRLSVRQAEQRFSKIFGIRAKAIISNYPELANDVDKPSDLLFVQKYLLENYE
jgi:molybdopterin-guanine dinucleotide biosynthesis protein A